MLLTLYGTELVYSHSRCGNDCKQRSEWLPRKRTNAPKRAEAGKKKYAHTYDFVAIRDNTANLEFSKLESVKLQ